MGLDIKNATSDFEAGLKGAIKTVFPLCTLNPCLFHYAQVRKISFKNLQVITYYYISGACDKYQKENEAT